MEKRRFNPEQPNARSTGEEDVVVWMQENEVRRAAHEANMRQKRRRLLAARSMILAANARAKAKSDTPPRSAET